MPNYGYYPSPYSGAQVDAAVAAVLALPSGGVISETINSSFTLTPLSVTDAAIVLSPVSSGVSYIYTNPVSSGAIVIDSGCRAQIKFTTLSANIPFMFPTGASFIGTSQFDSGASYLIAINYPEIVCVPYTTVTSA